MKIIKLIVVFSLLAGTLLALDKAKAPLDCEEGPRAYHFDMRHIEGKGIGYDQGYSTLEIFFSPREKNPAFLDLRGHYFNNGKWAANGGFGARYKPESWCTLLGANLYYDYRRAKKSNFHQIGFGLEMLGSVLEVRANGYLPIINKRSHYYSADFAEFAGHHILLQRKNKIAMNGVDAEIGFNVKHRKNWTLYTGIGPYFFDAGVGKTALGGKLRVTAKYSQYIAADFSASYDQVFRKIVQGQFTLSLPFGPRDRTEVKSCNNSCSKASALAERMVQPIVRDEIIVLKTHKKNEVAINPLTGEPYFVWFVNNMSSSAGTFESPFPTLAQAQSASSPNDMIYVFQGDGTSTGMDAGITLKDNQLFFGSGTNQFIEAQGGEVTIPSQTPLMPILTRTGASIVTLANNNEVTGFDLIGDAQTTPPTSGIIYGTDINSVTIRGNLFNTLHGDRIVLNNISGAVVIQGNNMCVPVTNTPFPVYGPANYGVFVGGTINAEFTISQNTFANCNNAISFGDFSDANLIGTCALDITNNTFISCPTKAIVIATDSATLAANINSNLMISCGTVLELQESRGFNIPNNWALKFIGNTAEGVGAVIDFAVNEGVLALEVAENTLSCSDAALTMTIQSHGPIALNIHDNTISCDRADGIEIVHFTNPGSVALTVESNTLFSSAPAIVYQAQIGANILHIQNNTLYAKDDPLAPDTVQITTAAAGDVCLRYLNNLTTPQTTILFDNTAGGTFNLEPVGTGNSGIITKIGVTDVPANTCE